VRGINLQSCPRARESHFHLLLLFPRRLALAEERPIYPEENKETLQKPRKKLEKKKEGRSNEQ
jgi:hypothetical protein